MSMSFWFAKEKMGVLLIDDIFYQSLFEVVELNILQNQDTFPVCILSSFTK